MINFESTPHEYKPYASQFPDEAFKEAILTKQDQYNKGYDAEQQGINGLDINALPGPDTDKKNEILGQLKSEISQFSNADYGDRNTQASIDKIISKYTNNADLQAISSHYVNHANLSAKAEKLTANGEQLNPEDKLPLTGWQKYMNGDAFVRNPDVKGDVYKATDWKKELMSRYKTAWDAMKDQGVVDEKRMTTDDEYATGVNKKLDDAVYKQTLEDPRLGNINSEGALSRVGQHEAQSNDLLTAYQDQARSRINSFKQRPTDQTGKETGLSHMEELQLIATSPLSKPDEKASAISALNTMNSEIEEESKKLSPSFDSHTAQKLREQEWLHEQVNNAGQSYRLLSDAHGKNSAKKQEADETFRRDTHLKAMEITESQRRQNQELQDKLTEEANTAALHADYSHGKLSPSTTKEIYELIDKHGSTEAQLPDGSGYNPTTSFAKKTKVDLPMSLANTKMSIEAYYKKGSMVSKSAGAGVTDDDGNQKYIQVPAETDGMHTANLTPSSAYVEGNNLHLVFDAKDSKGHQIERVIAKPEAPTSKPTAEAKPAETTSATPAPKKMVVSMK